MNYLSPLFLALMFAVVAPCSSADIKRGEMFGYLLFDGERVPEDFNAGFSVVANGPFQARLGDGSVVTYYWYRFADQPAMLNADLTPEEREIVQKRVEKLHRTWTKDRNYLAPPDVGTLASLDPALILTPPRGLEVGHGKGSGLTPS